MVVLVTGATGFIGAHTLTLLIEQGFKVIALYLSKDSPYQVNSELHSRMASEMLILFGFRKFSSKNCQTFLLQMNGA